MSRSLIKRTIIFSALLFGILPKYYVAAKQHPYEVLGNEVFQSLKDQNFNQFFHNSVFSLKEQDFKKFLFNIRNQEIRNQMTEFHMVPIPDGITSAQKKWEIVFAHNWRKEWRHLATSTPSKIKSESFHPILAAANEYGLQWKTVTLESVEILLPITWKNGRFEVKRDRDLQESNSDDRKLFFDRNIFYRLRPDDSTYSKSFMIGIKNEDSESIYKEGIMGNRSGQGDILLKFSEKTPSVLYYFCPDQKSAGGEISVIDSQDSEKPNQRHNLLITISFGNPEKFFQILLKEVMIVEGNALFFDQPQWLGEVEKPDFLEI